MTQAISFYFCPGERPTLQVPNSHSVIDANPLAAPCLEIVDLQISYGNTVALKHIDLSVARGEFVALLGPSGCGKTSLLRAIAGFVNPQRGAVRLNGRDVAALPPRGRNIGLVFQSYALFPHMTVLANVLFGLECRKVPKDAALARARQALDLVGLAAFADRRPKQLSGGQQQRVALARAIVIEPDMLLLDEPLGALDKQLRVQMQSELKTLQRRVGVTALFVTHDQEEAMSMADRIVVMRDGRIVQIDTPEQLFRAPNSAWVCAFVGAGNLLRGDLTAAGGGRWGLQLGPGSTVEVAAEAVGAAGVVQLPFDKVRLSPADGDEGQPIVARRFLGAMVELHLAYNHGTITAQMPAVEAAAFSVGSRARITAAPEDCRLVADE